MTKGPTTADKVRQQRAELEKRLAIAEHDASAFRAQIATIDGVLKLMVVTRKRKGAKPHG